MEPAASDGKGEYHQDSPNGGDAADEHDAVPKLMAGRKFHSAVLAWPYLAARYALGRVRCRPPRETASNRLKRPSVSYSVPISEMDRSECGRLNGKEDGE